MRPLDALMLLAAIAGGLIASAMSFGHLPGRSSSGDTILEVFATYTSFEGDHHYVFLRVFTDGVAECESSKPSDPEHAMRKRLLTKDEYAKIKSAVDEPKVAKLGPRYETWYGVIDTSTEWRIEIRRTSQTQVIQILNFSPGLTKIMKHPYPNELLKLGCNVEKLRADVIGEAPSLHSECKKVFGVKDRPTRKPEP